MIGEAELQEVDAPDADLVQTQQQRSHLVLHIGHYRHLHHHARDVLFGKRHVGKHFFLYFGCVFHLIAEADLVKSGIPEGHKHCLVQQVAGGIEAQVRLGVQLARMVKEGCSLCRVQQRLTPRQGDVRQHLPRMVIALQFPAPVVFGGKMRLKIFLIRVEAEETIAVAAEGNVARQGVYALFAHLAGRGDVPIDKTRPVAARRDLREGPQRGPLLRDLRLRRGVCLKRQAELSDLRQKALVDIHVDPSVVPKCGIADAAQVLACDFFQHVHPSRRYSTLNSPFAQLK